MAEPIVVPLSDGQIAAFREFAERARTARRELDLLPEMERIAIVAIVLGAVSPDVVAGGRLHLDLDAKSITVTPKES